MQRTRRGAIVAAIHLAVATITTWPLASHLTTHIPLGRETTPTVPLFNLWSLEWNRQRIQHLYRGYWDAPIFWPTRGAFARSEAQPLTGLLFTAFRTFVGSATAYNLVLLAFLTLNGVAATMLARRLHASWLPALAVGIAAQSLPFVWNQLGVLQLVCIFPMLFVVERLIAYRSSKRIGTLLGAAAWCVACVWTSGYYAIFLVIMVAIAVPMLLIGVVPFARLWCHGCAAAVVVIMCAVPYLLWQQQQLSTSDTWSAKTVEKLSAYPGDYIDQYDDAVTIPIFRDDGNRNGKRETPGVYLLAAGLVGAVVGFVKQQRRVAAAMFATGFAMYWFSLGMHTSVLGWRPYRWLYEHVSAFSRLRSPFRFSVGIQVALIALAALAATAVFRWRPPGGAILTVGFAALLVLESVPFGAHLQAVPNTERYGWVQHLDAASPGVVAMVPFPASGSASQFRDTIIAMLAGLHHGHPIVNGYTGFFPQQFDAAVSEGGLWFAMKEFPNRCAAEQLQRRDVRYVVINQSWRTPSRNATITQLGYVLEYEDESNAIFVDDMQYRYRDECA